MNRLILGIVLTLTLLVSITTFLSLGTSPRPQQSSGVLRIVTSFYPLGYIASSIAGDRADVEILTPPGAEPHDFEPTLRDIASLGTADMFLYNGAGFEPWISKWSTGSFVRPRVVFDMIAELQKKGVEPISHNGVVDPHVWLDPRFLNEEVTLVRDALIVLDPAFSDTYTERAAQLSAKLLGLDTHIKEGLSVCDLHEIVVSHNAFSYFARAYGFSTIAISGISPDEEPSSKVLSEIISTVRAKKLPTVFFESTVNPKLSEVIAREAGVSTSVLSTLESLSSNEVQSGEDYITLMEKNLTQLHTALLCH